MIHIFSILAEIKFRLLLVLVLHMCHVLVCAFLPVVVPPLGQGRKHLPSCHGAVQSSHRSEPP